MFFKRVTKTMVPMNSTQGIAKEKLKKKYQSSLKTLTDLNVLVAPLND